VLFDWALPACLRFVRKELQEISPTEDAGLARGAMRIIEACLDDFREGQFAWKDMGCLGASRHSAESNSMRTAGLLCSVEGDTHRDP
jgi:hypothetical protein